MEITINSRVDLKEGKKDDREYSFQVVVIDCPELISMLSAIKSFVQKEHGVMVNDITIDRFGIQATVRSGSKLDPENVKKVSIDL